MTKKSNTVQAIKKTSKQKIEKEETIQLKTGITLLDLVLNGGFPMGTINNIVGDSSSGKTFIALEYIAYMKSIHGDKLKYYYDDCEGGFSFDTKSMYGLEIIPDDQIPSTTVEDMAGNLNKQISKLKKDEILIYVVDSLDGLSSEAERKRDEERQKAIEAGKEYDKGTYAMEKQKFMSEFFRLRAAEIKHKNVILLVISQVRHNIGVMFGEKYVRSGGKALDFYAWSALWLAVPEKIKKKERTIGVTIKARTKKIKAKHPFRECYLNLLFDYGLDNISSNIDFLYDLKTPQGKQKPKAKCEWDEKEYSREGLIYYIEEYNLEDELEKRVLEKWNKIESSISSEERKSKWN
jgi:recombination protein RecA